MRQKLLILFFFITFQLAVGQVGIGTTNPSASSALEIRSTNSGLLIPRISLTSTSDNTTIAAPATSLMVYNTNTANDVTPGFYYWEGSWKKFSSGTTPTTTTSGWNLTGNTVTGSDYLGTNNYFPLIFKVNNNPFSRYHPNGGLAIGTGAAANDNNSIAIGTAATATNSNQAVAIGPSTNAAGYQSVAIGLSAATSNNNTVALGTSANASGYLGTAIGVSSTSSNNNAFAIGNSASASGEQSLAIGQSANSSGQNATAIGYQATTSQANAIVLGSTSTNSKIGIGTNTPEERLHVVGSIKMVDGNQANNYVLTSDANGKASWKAPASTTVPTAYGELYKNNTSNLAAGALTFGTNGAASPIVSLNGGNTIQVSLAGTYRITYTVSLRKNSGSVVNVEFFLKTYSDEIPGTRSFITINNGETRTVSVTKIVDLTAYQGILVHSSLGDNNISVLANGANLTVELIK